MGVLLDPELIMDSWVAVVAKGTLSQVVLIFQQHCSLDKGNLSQSHMPWWLPDWMTVMSTVWDWLWKVLQNCPQCVARHDWDRSLCYCAKPLATQFEVLGLTFKAPNGTGPMCFKVQLKWVPTYKPTTTIRSPLCSGWWLHVRRPFLCCHRGGSFLSWGNSIVLPLCLFWGGL